jgi:hypothetical protein
MDLVMFIVMASGLAYASSVADLAQKRQTNNATCYYPDGNVAGKSPYQFGRSSLTKCEMTGNMWLARAARFLRVASRLRVTYACQTGFVTTQRNQV